VVIFAFLAFSVKKVAPAVLLSSAVPACADDAIVNPKKMIFKNEKSLFTKLHPLVSEKERAKDN
jgi:hypothetical protein